MRMLASISFAVVLLLFGRSATSALDVGGDDETNASYSFDTYVQDYGKVYNSNDGEYERRQIIFEQNQKIIAAHNLQQQQSPQQRSYVMGRNQFTDRSEEELPLGYDKSFHAAWRPQSTTTTMAAATTVERSLGQTHLLLLKTKKDDLPTAVDWRRKGGVTTPIKNQGGCGSCWAFAATAALESHVALQTSTLFSLSMQELVSCAPNPNDCGGQGGCTGSTAELAYDFVARHGITEEWSFAYQSYHGARVNCTILPDEHNHHEEDSDSPNLRLGRARDDTDSAASGDAMVEGAVASIVGFSNLPSNQYATLLIAVATMGPVVVNVAASGWGLYKGGVFNDDHAETRDINHAVVLEGYGTDQETGEDYWLIRNSWGPRWGEDGYIRLKRVDPSTLEDPTSDCKLDDKPGDGIACKKDDNGKDVTPAAVPVCGTSGVLFDGLVPIGGHLL